MEHYFSRNSDTVHNVKIIKYKYKDFEISFKTDNAVFSKNKIDFGSDLLINSIESVGEKVLDFGCGYGAIGVSVAKNNFKSNILMIDINERAVGLANENCKLNDLENAKAIQSNGFGSVREKFDTILINPPIRVGKIFLYNIYEEMPKYLNPKGELYLVVRKQQGGYSTRIKLNEVFGNCEICNKKSGYLILKSKAI